MTQDPAAQDMRLGELEHTIMPAILLRQFHVSCLPSKSGAEPTLQPVAVEIYLFASEEIAERVQADSNVKLNLADWNSGTHKVQYRKYIAHNAVRHQKL